MENAFEKEGFLYLPAAAAQQLGNVAIQICCCLESSSVLLTLRALGVFTMQFRSFEATFDTGTVGHERGRLNHTVKAR